MGWRVVEEGPSRYFRAYECELVAAPGGDGDEFSFEEVRGARLGPIEAIGERSARLIHAREEAVRARIEAQRREEARRAHDDRAAGQDARPEGKRKANNGIHHPGGNPTNALHNKENLGAGRETSSTIPGEQVKERGGTRPIDDTQKDENQERQKKRPRVLGQVSGENGTKPVPGGKGWSTDQPLHGQAIIDVVEKLTPQQNRVQRKAQHTPTMTFHTKKALDDVMPLFNENFTDDKSGLSPGSPSMANIPGVQVQSRKQGPTTPTITINTKAAVANVMSMFSSPILEEAASADLLPSDEPENRKPSRSALTPGPGARKGLAVLKPSKRTNGEVLQHLAHTTRSQALDASLSPQVGQGLEWDDADDGFVL
jgi:hypothetical protein